MAGPGGETGLPWLAYGHQRGGIVGSEHAFGGARRAQLEAQDARMRMRAAQECCMQQAWKAQVVGITTPARGEAPRMRARRGEADEAGARAFSGGLLH
jgi:hypothetical protein